MLRWTVAMLAIAIIAACRPQPSPFRRTITTTEDPHAAERQRRADALRREHERAHAEKECKRLTAAARAEKDLRRKTVILDSMTPECVRRMNSKAPPPPPPKPVPPPVVATKPIRTYKTRALCFVGHPWPACRGIWVMEGTLRYGTGPYIGAEFGGLRNISRRTAIGAIIGISGSLDDFDGNGGFSAKLRVRKWLGNGHRIFGAPHYDITGGFYVGMQDVPTPGRPDILETGYYPGIAAEAALGIGDLIALSAGVNFANPDRGFQADLSVGIRFNVSWLLEPWMVLFGWMGAIPDLRGLGPMR